MLKVPHEVGAHMGGCYRPQKFKDLIENIRSFFIYTIMKHLHKFEAFIIPKPLRKYHPWWSDEDIALQVLKDLKDIKKSGQTIDFKSGDRCYTFELDGYEFKVNYYLETDRDGGARSMVGYMYLDGGSLEVSTEVCKKIYELIEDMLYEESTPAENKKSFRIRKNLI